MDSGDYHNGSMVDSSNVDSRKLFLGGLPRDATKQEIEAHFGQYGEIEQLDVKLNPVTFESRGFAFLIYKDKRSVDSALSTKHEMKGKEIDAKIAKPQTREAPERSTKIYVGGLEKDVDSETVKAAFQTRGSVTDVHIPTDMGGESRGYAFVNFEDTVLAETLCREGTAMINGKEVHIKPATRKSDSMRGGRGGRDGGFRGGRGGYQGYGQGAYAQGGYSQGGYGQSGYGFGGGYGAGYGAAYGGGASYGADYYASAYAPASYGQGYGYEQSYGAGGYAGGAMKGSGRGSGYQPY